MLASKGKRLYMGVTSQLELRIRQHKNRKYAESFTARYNIDQLVWYQGYESIREAIAREPQIRNMHRIEKIALIVAHNPEWKDLSEPWGKPVVAFSEEAMHPPEQFGGAETKRATATTNTEILASPE